MSPFYYCSLSTVKISYFKMLQNVRSLIKQWHPFYDSSDIKIVWEIIVYKFGWLAIYRILYFKILQTVFKMAGWNIVLEICLDLDEEICNEACKIAYHRHDKISLIIFLHSVIAKLWRFFINRLSLKTLYNAGPSKFKANSLL